MQKLQFRRLVGFKAGKTGLHDPTKIEEFFNKIELIKVGEVLIAVELLEERKDVHLILTLHVALGEQLQNLRLFGRGFEVRIDFGLGYILALNEIFEKLH